MSINVSTRVLATLALLVAVMMVGVVVPAAADEPVTSDVHSLSSGEDVGDAQLVRGPNGVSMELTTTQLDPGAAYTVWWVVFNNPEYCVDGCDASDSGIPEVQATVLAAAGHVVGATGQSSFAGHLQVGDTSGDSFPPLLPGDSVGLVDVMKAEIHLAVRTHGTPIAGMVAEQISTFNGGGCSDPMNPNDACETQQVAVFPGVD